MRCMNLHTRETRGPRNRCHVHKTSNQVGDLFLRRRSRLTKAPSEHVEFYSGRRQWMRVQRFRTLPPRVIDLHPKMVTALRAAFCIRLEFVAVGQAACQRPALVTDMLANPGQRKADGSGGDRFFK